jgi:methionine-rich copper-binding protein CopC
MFATAAPAGAHAVVVGTSPHSGERLGVSLTRVQVRLQAPVDRSLSRMVVRGPDGRNWAAGPLEGGENVLVQRVVAAAPTGAYTATYRIVSADGHVLVGSVHFTTTVGGSVPGSAGHVALVKGARRSAGPAASTGATSLTGRLTAGFSLTGGAVILLLLLVRVIGRHRSARNALGP